MSASLAITRATTRFTRRLRLVVHGSGVAELIVWSLGFIIILALLDWWQQVPPLMRLLAVVVGALWLARRLQVRWLQPARQPVTPHDCAVLLERRFPQLNGRALSAVAGIALSQRDESSVDDVLEPAAIDAVVTTSRLWRWAWPAFGLLSFAL